MTVIVIVCLKKVSVNFTCSLVPFGFLKIHDEVGTFLVRHITFENLVRPSDSLTTKFKTAPLILAVVRTRKNKFAVSPKVRANTTKTRRAFTADEHDFRLKFASVRQKPRTFNIFSTMVETR